MPTPYAILMVRPSDNDGVIRRAFHEISKNCHPDKLPLNLSDCKLEELRKRWFAVAAAYSIIKTAEGRLRHDDYMRNLAGVCETCNGSGIRGSRSAGSKLRLCDECQGEGRAR